MDSGNLLFRQKYNGRNPDISLSLQGKRFIESYNAMGWTALGIGDSDLAFGIEYLKELESMADFPFLSANILDKEGGEYVFTPYTIKKLSGFKVGITAIIGKDLLKSDKKDQMGIYIDDEELALKKVFKEFKRKVDFVIVLSPTGFKEGKIIAEKFDEIDLILTGYKPTTNLYQPTKIGNALIAQVFSRGKYIGRLDIEINDSSRPYNLYIEGKNENVNSEYKILETRRKHLEKAYNKFLKKKEEGKNVDAGLKILKNDLDKIIAKMNKLKDESESKNRNTISASLITLDDNLANDPEVKKIGEKYKDEVIDKNSNLQKDMLKNGKRSPTDLAQDPHYVGSKVCGTCHHAISAFVKKTRHSIAFETLEKEKRQFEANCFECHTTGYKKPGGFTNIFTAKNLLDVQCEACHGPASRHVLDSTVKLKKPTSKNDCISCHDSDNDDNFIYSTDVKIIKCPNI